MQGLLSSFHYLKKMFRWNFDFKLFSNARTRQNGCVAVCSYVMVNELSVFV